MTDAALSVSPIRLGPAEEVLSSCARTQIDEPTRARVASILEGGIDWERLLALARWHQVEPLFAASVISHFGALCPPDSLERLRACLRTGAARAARMEVDLVRIAQLLDAHDIRYLAYKGPLLGRRVYGSAGLRSFVDLDVQVPARDYEHRIDEVLAGAGFRLLEDFGFERAYADASGVQIDIHRDLFPPWIPLGLAFDDAWRKARIELLRGAAIRTFGDEELAIVLFTQLAKDIGESGGEPPLQKLCDVAELMRASSSIPWERVVARAQALGAVRIAAVAAAAARDLLGAPVPAPLAALVERDRVVPGLVAHVVQRLLGDRAEAGARAELLDERRWHAQVRERARDRVRPAMLQLTALARPAGPDYAAIELHGRWRVFYWLVRPVRLAWRWSSTRVRGDDDGGRSR